MKKIIFALICTISFPALYGQNEKKEGDAFAANENYSGAAMMYRLCMEQDKECQLKLIRLIYEEKIEPQSADELYRLIYPLAEQGDAESQYYLSELYKNGKGGVTRDYGEMMKWLRKSADQGYANTSTELVKMYELTAYRGDELAASGHFDEAAGMYRLVLEQDEQNALKLFKLIYDKKTEPQTPDELIRLINPLVAKGNSEAQYCLSLLYRTGIGGVQQNDDEAVELLKMSADQGFLKAKEEYTAMTPPKEVVAPAKTAEVTTPAVNIPRQRTQEINMASYQSKKPGSKGGVFLMVLGGLSIAGGTAASYLLPPETSIDESRISQGQVGTVKTPKSIYMYAGCAVGGACVITGIILKVKQSKNQQKALAENFNLQSLPQHDNAVHLNLVATGTGAGLCLTF